MKLWPAQLGLQFVWLCSGCVTNTGLSVFKTLLPIRRAGCAEDEKMLNDFRNKNQENLAIDGGGYLTYLATSQLICRW